MAGLSIDGLWQSSMWCWWVEEKDLCQSRSVLDSNQRQTQPIGNLFQSATSNEEDPNRSRWRESLSSALLHHFPIQTNKRFLPFVRIRLSVTVREFLGSDRSFSRNDQSERLSSPDSAIFSAQSVNFGETPTRTTFHSISSKHHQYKKSSMLCAQWKDDFRMKMSSSMERRRFLLVAVSILWWEIKVWEIFYLPCKLWVSMWPCSHFLTGNGSFQSKKHINGDVLQRCTGWVIRLTWMQWIVEPGNRSIKEFECFPNTIQSSSLCYLWNDLSVVVCSYQSVSTVNI